MYNVSTIEVNDGKLRGWNLFDMLRLTLVCALMEKFTRSDGDPPKPLFGSLFHIRITIKVTITIVF